MGKRSTYNNKDCIHLCSVDEQDLLLLQKHKDVKRIVLELEGLSVDTLDFLRPCLNVQEIVIYGGKIKDYSALEALTTLNKLFLNGRLRRWQESFDFLSGIIGLEYLNIMNYPLFTRFPNLEKLAKLTRVKISGCKRLTDISEVASIPNLAYFGIVSTPQTVEDLEFIAKKEGMKAMSGAFGSKKKDDEFSVLLQKYGLVYGLYL